MFAGQSTIKKKKKSFARALVANVTFAVIEESGQTLDKPWTRTVYDTPPIGQKKIRIGEDYCEIDVSCRERYTEELFSVLIFIDLKKRFKFR